MKRPRVLRSRRKGYQRAAVRVMVLAPSMAVAAGAFCAPADRPQVPHPERLAVTGGGWFCQARPGLVRSRTAGSLPRLARPFEGQIDNCEARRLGAC
jgi:hypothetical protein